MPVDTTAVEEHSRKRVLVDTAEPMEPKEKNEKKPRKKKETVYDMMKRYAESEQSWVDIEGNECAASSSEAVMIRAKMNDLLKKREKHEENTSGAYLRALGFVTRTLFLRDRDRDVEKHPKRCGLHRHEWLAIILMEPTLVESTWAVARASTGAYKQFVDEIRDDVKYLLDSGAKYMGVKSESQQVWYANFIMMLFGEQR
jgi:hypothetical protein